VFLEKYGFNLYKGFLIEKIDLNLPDIEGFGFQRTRFL
jgi:hypothetical protein